MFKSFLTKARNIEVKSFNGPPY